MNKSSLLIKFLVGISLSLLIGSLHADPPSRVIRLSYYTGNLSFSPASQSMWVHAVKNRPFTRGDKLWSHPKSQGELQMDGATACLGNSTSIALLNVNEKIIQVKVPQGRFNLYVRSLEPKQMYEIDTPNLALLIDKPGYYQVDVSPRKKYTEVSIQRGRAQVYGVKGAYRIKSGRAYKFYGNDLKYFQTGKFSNDSFDRWCLDRAKKADRTLAKKYVPKGVVGYEDLDRHGNWITIKEYGRVWSPTRVSRDWAPYRHGRWMWVNPWGWTWVDNEPWGFAPYHYGRWTFHDHRWYWVPGRTSHRAVYAPALVAFIGGRDFGLSLSIGGSSRGGVAWFPLGPRDVYVPPYQVSRGYFQNINTSNTTINNTTINNVYNNPTNITNITYQNQAVPQSITAVPTESFVQSQPVADNQVEVNAQTVEDASITAAAPVAPEATSVTGTSKPSDEKPPEEIMEEKVVAKTEVPPPPVEFEKIQDKLAEDPGKPLAPETLESLEVKPQEEIIVINPEVASEIAPLPAKPDAPAPAGVEELTQPSTAPEESGAPTTPEEITAPEEPQVEPSAPPLLEEPEAPSTTEPSEPGTPTVPEDRKVEPSAPPLLEEPEAPSTTEPSEPETPTVPEDRKVEPSAPPLLEGDTPSPTPEPGTPTEEEPRVEPSAPPLSEDSEPSSPVPGEEPTPTVPEESLRDSVPADISPAPSEVERNLPIPSQEEEFKPSEESSAPIQDIPREITAPEEPLPSEGSTITPEVPSFVPEPLPPLEDIPASREEVVPDPVIPTPGETQTLPSDPRINPEEPEEEE